MKSILKIENCKFKIAASKRLRGGYIALISILIISVTLLIAVISLGGRGISSRFLLLDLERKDAANELANACIQVGTIAVVGNPSYCVNSGSCSSNPPVYVNVGSQTCELHKITPVANLSIIQASASSSGATANFEVTVDNVLGTITGRSEKDSF